MTSRKHVIAGAPKSGLEPNYFLPRNSPRATTCPFTNTVVSIAARPQLFKARAPSIPAMRGDHRSHDLDGASELMAEICPFQVCRIRSDPFKSTGVIFFAIQHSEFSTLKPCFLPQ
jgi:hypothetical protein